MKGGGILIFQVSGKQINGTLLNGTSEIEGDAV